jgi:hypothetical protein
MAPGWADTPAPAWVTAVVAPAVGAAALAAAVARVASTMTSLAPYLQAFFSWTLAMSHQEQVAAVFPLKWEDMVYCTVIALVNCTIVLVAVLALAATTPTRPVPSVSVRTRRSLLAIALHTTYLGIQAYMETMYKEQLHAVYLCTWSWWSTTVYAVVCLLTAHDVNWPAPFPLTAATLLASIGLSVWTHISYLRILPTYPIQNVLHALPFCYYILSLWLDDRRRPPLPLRTATVVTHVTGVVPIAILYWYGQIYDYRDIYSGFFEMFGVSSWWPSLETTLMSATALLAGHLLYGYASASVPSGRRRVLNLVIIFVTASVLPVVILIVQPVRLHHLRNCPPAPLNLLYRDVTRGGAIVVNATTAAQLRATVFAPVYAHAVLTGPGASRAVADAFLERTLISPVLAPLCPPTVVPPAVNGSAWVRVVPLPFAHAAFRSRVINPTYAFARAGTALLVYSDAGTEEDGAARAVARALLATLPSVVYHLAAVPDDDGLARFMALAADAAALRAACTPAGCAGTFDEGAISNALALEAPTSSSPAPVAVSTHDDATHRDSTVAGGPPPLGVAAVVVAEVGAGVERTWPDHNMTTYLHARLTPADARRARTLFARLDLMELGAARADPALLATWIQEGMQFARWQGMFPYALQQFPAYIPPTTGPEGLNRFLASLAAALSAA